MKFSTKSAKNACRGLVVASVVSVLSANNVALAKINEQEKGYRHASQPILAFVFLQPMSKGFASEQWLLPDAFKAMFSSDAGWAGNNGHEDGRRYSGLSRVAFVQLIPSQRDTGQYGFVANQFDFSSIFRHDTKLDFRHHQDNGNDHLRGNVFAFLNRDKHHHDNFLQSSGDFCEVPVPAPIPEPSSVALLLAGLGLMGTFARRRKSEWPDEQY